MKDAKDFDMKQIEEAFTKHHFDEVRLKAKPQSQPEDRGEEAPK